MLVAQLCMDLVQINFSNRHLVARVLKIVFEQIKVPLVDFIDQMHRQIVEVILNRMRPFGAMPFTFVKRGIFLRFTFLGVLTSLRTSAMPSLNVSVQKILS